MNRRFSIIAVLLSACLLIGAVSAQQPTPTPTPEITAGTIYLKAVQLFRNENYEKASQGFREVLIRFPDSTYAADSVFKIAEGAFRLEQYELAGGYYRLYLEMFSLAANTAEAEFRLEQCETKVGHTIAAIRPKLQAKHPAIRAVWVQRFFQTTWPALDAALADLKRQGVNTLIAPAYHWQEISAHGFLANARGKGAYFRTKKLPVLDAHLDRLAGMTRKYGMRLFVTLPPLRLPIGDKSVRYNPITAGFEVSEKCDPFSAATVEALEAIAGELALEPIDGVVLTGLMLSPLEGYSSSAMEHYEQGLGKTPLPAEFFTDVEKSRLGLIKYEISNTYDPVAHLKTATVSGLAEKMAEAIKRVNPNIEVWITLSPDTADSKEQGRRRSSQDAKTLGGPPFTGVVFDDGAGHGEKPSSLTPTERFASIGRRYRQLTAGDLTPASVMFRFSVLDKISRKPRAAWEVQEETKAGAPDDKVGLAATPWSNAFDYAILFAPDTKKSGDGK